ncbi:MAG: ATP synthase F1 subunit epsilon [Thermotogae bacterium]|jgi:F-type H+-transporting ATPase subunit epsilon|nr:ATP synthase F1 subunit epsilon [Thermotogota bacterium]MCL5032872.1 ATP synthase F1 subunit epsilon [Thermotogota bacterium]
MEYNMFRLRIITPEKVAFDKMVNFIEFKTINGAMGTLQNRLPLFVALDIAEFEIEQENGKISFFAVHGGIGEFFNNVFTVLSDAAERPEDIDVERAKRSLERARVDIEEVEEIRRKELEMKIQRALIRLKISQKKER